MSSTSLLYVTRRSRRLDAIYREISELIVGLDEVRQNHWLGLVEEALPVPGPAIHCGKIAGVLLEPSPALLELLGLLRRETGRLAA